MVSLMNNEDEILTKLIQTFYKGSLNFSIKPEEITVMSWSWQEKFLNATAHSKLIKKYPLSNQFYRLFYKKIIGYLESSHEVHDDFYTQLCKAMSNECGKNSFSYHHYLICNDLNNVITLKETNNMVVNGTTGMRTWEAALFLSDWALCNKEIFNSKKVLELGSGVGFTGITIGKLCQTENLILTDCHNEVLKTISDNIKINFPHLKIEEHQDNTLFKNPENSIGVMMLDWNDIEELPVDVVPDIVIGADIVYDPSILKPLCNVIHTFFKRNEHLEVYIASVIRNEETFHWFLKTLEGMNFTYEEIAISESVCIEWDHRIHRCLLNIKYKYGNT